MKQDFHIIIPARYQSARLPGKLLLKLKNNMTILESVYRQACQANPKSLHIATDHPAIADEAKRFGASVIMTSPQHQTGTARITEVVKHFNFDPNDIIVNVQGDEPFLAPELINQVAQCLTTTSAPMATLCSPLPTLEEFHNPNVVKVVRDATQHALYFSRSPIPMHRDNPTALSQVFRHIGLYAYRAYFLLEMVDWPRCELASIESLEQLAVLWAGYKIKVDLACAAATPDINTLEDYQKACRSKNMSSLLLR